MIRRGDWRDGKGESPRNFLFSLTQFTCHPFQKLHSNMIRSTARTLLRSSVQPTPYLQRVVAPSFPRPSHQKFYSSKPAASEEPTQEPAAAATGESGASPATPDATVELNAKLDQQSKTIAELKVSFLPLPLYPT